jgi:hypothetical protein
MPSYLTGWVDANRNLRTVDQSGRSRVMIGWDCDVACPVSFT